MALLIYKMRTFVDYNDKRTANELKKSLSEL